jgi:hypothetical protein
MVLPEMKWVVDPAFIVRLKNSGTIPSPDENVVVPLRIHVLFPERACGWPLYC